MFELFESLLLGGGDRKEDKFDKIDIVGNYNFYVEPCIKGFIGLHSSTIVIQVYEDSTKAKPLAFEVKWSKIFNNETYEMEGYSEKHYNITPSDIDLKIRAAVTCTSAYYPGVAYVYLGPIELDPTFKPELEGMIVNQIGNFKARVLSINTQSLPTNVCQIRVAKPTLTLNFDSSLEEVPELKALSDKGAFLPLEINFEEDSAIKVRTDSHSITDVVLTCKSDAGIETKYGLRFASRVQRDTFYIFLRLFRSIKSSFIEKLLGQYDVLLIANWSVLNLELEEEEDDPMNEPGYYLLLKHEGVRQLLRRQLRISRDMNQENLLRLDNLDSFQHKLDVAVAEFRNLVAQAKGASKTQLKQLEESGKSFLEDLKSLTTKKARKGSCDMSILADDDASSLRREIKDLKDKNDKIRVYIDQLNKGVIQPAFEVQYKPNLESF